MDTRAQANVDLRRAALAVTITSFSVAALMGIAALLGGGSFGDTEIRILLTTVAAGSGSLLALCCMVVLGGRFQPAGVLGLMVVALTTLFTLLLIWAADDSGAEDAFQAWGVCVTVAISVAHVCLLLGLAGRRTSLAWLMWLTVALVALLAGLVSAMILGWDGSDATWRFLGVVAILDVLGTLVAVALGVFGRDDRRSAGADLTVALRPETAARLREQSRRTGRPVSDLVDEALVRYVARPVD
jgi:ribbon-helix-helix protein